ncbi:putative ubiquitinyl hydrolase 1 [Helianthus annuus]|nr:putative ubiquitinyl hydrolase 1 [Helianthus annuus]
MENTSLACIGLNVLLLGDKREWCFPCEFEGLVLKEKNGSSSLSPVGILSQIEIIGSSLNQGRQEDTHEFLRCKSYEKAKKTLTLLEAPNVLTIALKRFQILDMAPYVSGTSDKSPVYRLYGVVVHVDIMNAAFSGHYVCHVRNVENRWFKIDDNRVKEVDVESVLTKGAYM